jgi:uncharacterized protein (DUF1810 family)
MSDNHNSYCITFLERRTTSIMNSDSIPTGSPTSSAYKLDKLDSSSTPLQYHCFGPRLEQPVTVVEPVA